ncbi:MAG TPA: hypothetical protein VJM34_15440 [Novosphingobium sp.]|nr:hypothetical protein [Novosphingobium sp.]
MSVLAALWGCGSSVQSAESSKGLLADWDSVKEEHLNTLLSYGFTTASGMRSYETRGIIGLNIYDNGRCIPIGNGQIGSAKLPYNGEFGPIGSHGVITANVIRDTVPAVLADYQLMAFGDGKFSGLPPARYKYPISLMCTSMKDGTKEQPAFDIYIEHARKSFEARSAELKRRKPSISSLVEGGNPACPTFVFTEGYWVKRTAIIFQMTLSEARDWRSNRRALACLARAAIASMGLPGIFTRPDDKVLDPIKRRFFSDDGRRLGGHVNVAPSDFLMLRLPAGTKRVDAISVARDLIVQRPDLIKE